MHCSVAGFQTHTWNSCIPCMHAQTHSALQLDTSTSQMPALQEELAGLQQQGEKSQALVDKAMQALGLDPATGTETADAQGHIVRSKEVGVVVLCWKSLLGVEG